MRTNPLLPLLGAAFAAILLLASLQYYWVGQLSQAYRERMQASLHSGITRFSEDFDREMALAYLTLQMDADTLRERDWSRYARRYDHWLKTANYPKLVADVYLVQLYADRRPVLQHFDPTKRLFTAQAWPDSLAPLQDQVNALAQAFTAGESATPLPPIYEPMPALLVPLSRVVKLSDDREVAVEANLLFGDDIIASTRRSCMFCRDQQRTPLFAYTLVALDQHYITNTMVPLLARRHIGTGNTLDYNISIVSRANPGQAIYRSDPRQKQLTADETATIFDVRLAAFNNLVSPHDFVDDPGSQRAGPLSPDRLVIGVYGQGVGSNQPSADGRWQLLLTHREGSLDRAVATLQNRNLLISSGMLLLLAASVAMVVVATRRAQRLARQQMAFVATVSHELRTPLAVICSAGENLADGVVRDPQQARQYGAVIHGEGRRLGEMVEQVLEFAGAESLQRRYIPTAIDLHTAVERAITICCPPRDRQHRSFEIDIPASLPPALADEAALLRALQNLIDNAMKYGDGTNWVGIFAWSSFGPYGYEVHISVRDRGIGIEPSELPHIFEPFFRGHVASAAQIRGSGLGLSLVRHIADALGGRLSVESSAAGSAFTLHLPAAPAQAAEAVPTAAD